MASRNRVVVAFFFALSLAMTKAVYTSQVLRGSVACFDCPQGSDLSALQVLVKCEKVKKLAMAYTKKDGKFETDLPSDKESKAGGPGNCMAKIMGGTQYGLYIPMSNAVVPVAKSKSGHSIVSKPLGFYKVCPVKGKCNAKDIPFESSKVLGTTMPGDGNPPLENYFPIPPIFSIP